MSTKFDANSCASALADMLQSWQTYFKYSIHYVGSSLDTHAPTAGDAEAEPDAEVHANSSLTVFFSFSLSPLLSFSATDITSSLFAFPTSTLNSAPRGRTKTRRSPWRRAPLTLNSHCSIRR